MQKRPAIPYKRPAVFFDRDGTLNRLIHERGPSETPIHPTEVELLPGVTDAVAQARQAGYAIVVVTNQPNLAKGKVTEKNHGLIRERLYELLGSKAAPDAYYECLHHPDPTQVVTPSLLARCQCRKPQPGLYHRAAAELGLDLSSSWAIGDSRIDIEAARAAGIPAAHCRLLKENNLVSVIVDVCASQQYHHPIWLR